MFSVWVGERVGTFTKPNLKKYAADLGLDTATFNKCIDNEETASVVQADEAEVQRLGLGGTPAFMINGRLLNIAPTDVAGFSRTFDSLLK